MRGNAYCSQPALRLAGAAPAACFCSTRAGRRRRRWACPPRDGARPEVAADAGELAVGEGLLAGLGERDERDGAESELAAASADDEALDPASGSGGLNEEVTGRCRLRQRHHTRRVAAGQFASAFHAPSRSSRRSALTTTRGVAVEAVGRERAARIPMFGRASGGASAASPAAVPERSERPRASPRPPGDPESHAPHSTAPPCARRSTTRGGMVALVRPVPVPMSLRSGRRAVVPAPRADKGRAFPSQRLSTREGGRSRVPDSGFAAAVFGSPSASRILATALRTDSGQRRGTCSAGAACCGRFGPSGPCSAA